MTVSGVKRALIMQAGEMVPVASVSNVTLLAAAISVKDLSLIGPIQAEIRRRGLTGGGFCAVLCSIADCGRKALYRVGKDGYCKYHEPAARAATPKQGGSEMSDNGYEYVGIRRRGTVTFTLSFDEDALNRDLLQKIAVGSADIRMRLGDLATWQDLMSKGAPITVSFPPDWNTPDVKMSIAHVDEGANGLADVTLRPVKEV